MHAEHADNRELNELSGRVIGCAFTVLNTFGAGFLERSTRSNCSPWGNDATLGTGSSGGQVILKQP